MQIPVESEQLIGTIWGGFDPGRYRLMGAEIKTENGQKEIYGIFAEIDLLTGIPKPTTMPDLKKMSSMYLCR